MRTFYALGICLFLMSPGALWGQAKKPQQGSQPAQAAPHQLIITPQEKALKNPVPFTEKSVAQGKSLFSTQCVMCHGKTGNGKGELATVMHVSPPDFTDPATLSQRTDGELFTIIKSGTGAMPSQGERLKVNQTWDLVNFLRSLEGKTPVKSKETRKRSAHR